MAVYIGSARIDERGKLSGGAAGDSKQTTTPDYTGEVSMQKFYVHSKGWYVLRPKNVNIAMGIAGSMIDACNNPNIGYDQNQRTNILKYGTKSKVKTETDCSTLIRLCVKEASGIDPGNFTTANEVNVLMKTNMFEKLTYIPGMILYTGDILVTKTKGHTVAVTSGAARNTATSKDTYYPTYQGSTTSITTALKAVGEKDVTLAHRKKIAEANKIANYSGTSTQNTTMLNLLKQGRLKKA